MPRLPNGNRQLIRAINRNTVLNRIKDKGPISRTDVARLSKLSLATVSEITGSLIDSGIIKETGEGESSGGRPPILLTLDPHAGFVVGLKLTEQAIIVAITDLTAEVLYQDHIPVNTAQSVQWVLSALARAVKKSIARSGVDSSKVLGVGVGLGGVIDGEEGVCRYSPILGWREVALSAPLGEILGLPVYVDNDVNTLAIAEQWFGYGRELDHFLTVTVGRGVGLGIVANGHFYRGLAGAGEFGHTTLQVGGPLCACGKRGCLEALASDLAVLRMVREALDAGRPSVLATATNRGTVALEDVVEAARAEDEVAREALAQAGRWLGIGIANLINVFHPELVIVAGEGVTAGAYRLEPMKTSIEQHTFDGLGDPVQIVVEPSGDETWARGAASLVLGQVFRSPLFAHKPLELSLTLA